MRTLLTTTLLFTMLAAAGCENKTETPANGDGAKADAGGAAEAPGIKTDKGVDLASKTIKIGTLNDESGPAAAIGKPFALGKRILAEQVNAGGSGILPEGWKVELVEKDHKYNPTESSRLYAEIKDDVLFVGTSFGTPNTLPLVPKLEQDNIVAMPATLSSKMAESVHTPPIGPAYFFEAMRALDWAAEDAGGADKVQLAVVYQNDDYGQDGVFAVEAASEKLGMKVVSKQSVTANQTDVTAVVTALKEAGATHVMLSVLPRTTGALLATAGQLEFGPKWMGNTPTWTDIFWAGKLVPTAVFANYYLVTGLPFWGEESEGMKSFLAAFEKHSGGANPDGYTLLSYTQGLAALEVAKRAIEAGDITRDGYKKQLASMSNWDGNGMLHKGLDWSKAPYVVGTETRVLKPDFEKKTWTVASDFAAPKGYEAPAAQ